MGNTSGVVWGQPHETRFVHALLQGRFTAALPATLIGDKAYDSDPPGQGCQALDVTLIAPHRRNRT